MRAVAYIRIDDTEYEFQPLTRGTTADGVRLLKTSADHEVYTLGRVALSRPYCTCPDYIHRRAAEPGFGPCKHGQALLELGIL